MLYLHSTLFPNQTLLGYVSLNERFSEARAPEQQLSLISAHMQPGCCKEMLLLVNPASPISQQLLLKNIFFPVRLVTF